MLRCVCTHVLAAYECRWYVCKVVRCVHVHACVREGGWEREKERENERERERETLYQMPDDNMGVCKAACGQIKLWVFLCWVV